MSLQNPRQCDAHWRIGETRLGTVLGSVRAASTRYGGADHRAPRWAAVKTVTLVVDECNFVDELIDALAASGGISDGKRLVFTSRERSPKVPSFEVPPLTVSESEQLIQDIVTEKNIADELTTIGNPLLLHHALLKIKFGS